MIMQADDTLYFYNCHSSIVQFIKDLNFNCKILDSADEITIKENPVVLSSWNQKPTRVWSEDIKYIRRKGVTNFIIVASFEKKETIFNNLNTDLYRIKYLRLPFRKDKLSSLSGSPTEVNEVSFLEFQQKLCREHIFTTLPKLEHGNKLEFANQVFVPLRAALVLDVSDEKKGTIVNKILKSGVTDFWSSEEMTELEESVKNLVPQNHPEEVLKDLFIQTERLLGSLSGEFLKCKFLNVIDTIDSCTRKLWVLKFFNNNS
jgi:hypothetical protein